MADVGEWLTSKNMGQYSPNFQQNEITGSVLMDISLEDLDYMGITILGHRKTILKGIEELSSGRVQVGLYAILIYCSLCLFFYSRTAFLY